MSDTTDVVSARWNASLSAVVGYIQPQSYTRRIKLMALNGPANSRLDIYRGYLPIAAMALSSVFPADVRTYDSTSGGVIPIAAGEAVTFSWTRGASASSSTATAVVTSEVS